MMNGCVIRCRDAERNYELNDPLCRAESIDLRIVHLSLAVEFAFEGGRFILPTDCIFGGCKEVASLLMNLNKYEYHKVYSLVLSLFHFFF